MNFFFFFDNEDFNWLETINWVDKWQLPTRPSHPHQILPPSKIYTHVSMGPLTSHSFYNNQKNIKTIIH